MCSLFCRLRPSIAPFNGREATERIVLETAGGVLTWDDYPRDTNYLYRLRDALIKAGEA